MPFVILIVLFYFICFDLFHLQLGLLSFLYEKKVMKCLSKK
jgi:hypothetical protein